MKNIKQFQGWRSEQIVKVFILNTGIMNLTENYSSIDTNIDYIGIYKENQNIRFGIEIKATKYSKTEINKTFSNISNQSLPIIYFFINYDNETGYFRLVDREFKSLLTEMEKGKFIREIKNYAQHTPM